MNPRQGVQNRAAEVRSQNSTAPVRRTTEAARRSTADTARRFCNEIESATRNSQSLAALQRQLLTILIRNAHVVGSLWCSNQGDCVAQQLPNPALQHPSVTLWIRGLARQTAADRTPASAVCPNVRNLLAMTFPVALPDKPVEVLVLCVSDSDALDTNHHVMLATACERAVVQWSLLQQSQEKSLQLRSVAAALDLSGQVENTESLLEAAQVVADRVHDYLNCDLVTIGQCLPGSVACCVLAISGLSEFDKHSTTSRRIKAALDESVLKGQLTSWPAADEASEHQTMAHRKLSDTISSACVISIPLRDNSEQTIGAMTIAGEKSLLCEETIRFLRVMDIPAGNALAAVHRKQAGPVRRFTRSLLGKRPFVRTLLLLSCLAMIAMALMIPMTYRMTARFVCEPATRNFSVAPFEGMLQTTLARPGDIVEAGQVLAIMDDRELRFELAGLVAEQHRAGKQRDVYLADEEVAKSFMSALDVDRVRNQTNLLQHRLSSLELCSPVSGVILSGPAEHRENYPVQVGELLYEIGPLDPLRLNVAIPAADRDHIEVGMPVEFRPDRDVNDLRTGTIQRIRPVTETVDERNVFIAEIEIRNPDSLLRPGMEGAARVLSHEKPAGWILLHRATDYVIQQLVW